MPGTTTIITPRDFKRMKSCAAKLDELYEKVKAWVEGDGAAIQQPELAMVVSNLYY